MSESRDMDAPVTRRELHEALDLWSGAINARTAAEIAESEKRVLGAVQIMFEASEQRLLRELRSQTQGSEDELASRLVAVDQQYKDLPARVTRLEAKVFAPPTRKRRRAQRTR